LHSAGFYKAVRRSRRRANRKLKSTYLLVTIGIVLVIAIAISGLFLLVGKGPPPSSSTTNQSTKRVILYVNQGNGLVNESRFPSLLSLALSHGFNTIFFQIYRGGNLVFSTNEMTYFVGAAHRDNLSIFFALYFTNSSQTIPSSIYGLGEDGISLDMSTIDFSTQVGLLASLKQNFHGLTAVTTTNFTTTLNPNILILETYSPLFQSYIHHGIVAGVEVLATQNKADYESQVQYALNNSDGVMVFDYYGLVVTGY
jgi:hypothetical protein